MNTNIYVISSLVWHQTPCHRQSCGHSARFQFHQPMAMTKWRCRGLLIKCTHNLNSTAPYANFCAICVCSSWGTWLCKRRFGSFFSSTEVLCPEGKYILESLNRVDHWNVKHHLKKMWSLLSRNRKWRFAKTVNQIFTEEIHCIFYKYTWCLYHLSWSLGQEHGHHWPPLCHGSSSSVINTL